MERTWWTLPASCIAIFIAGGAARRPGKVADAAHHAFVTGFNTVALVSVAVAAVGTVAGYALVRSRDFVGSDPAAASQEPARA